MNKIGLLLLNICFLSFSCNDNPKAEMNAEKIKLVKDSMSIAEVKGIMGKPDSVMVWEDEDQFRLMYVAPIGYSDNIYIMLSKKDSIVIGVNDGK